MPVFQGSRHQNQSKFTAPYTDSTGSTKTVSWLTNRKSISQKFYPDNFNITVGKSETLQNIATRVYGNPQLWWVIAEFNNIIDPTLEEEGGEVVENMVLIVPTLQRVLTEILPKV